MTERPLAAMTSLYCSSVLIIVTGILGCRGLDLEVGLRVVCEGGRGSVGCSGEHVRLKGIRNRMASYKAVSASATSLAKSSSPKRQ